HGGGVRSSRAVLPCSGKGSAKRQARSHSRRDTAEDFFCGRASLRCQMGGAPARASSFRQSAGERDRSGDRNLCHHARGRPELLRSANVVSPRSQRSLTRERQGGAMNEVLIGELREFADGGYPVL